MRKLTIVAVLFLVAGGAALCPTTAAEWNQWRGAGRDGVAHDSKPLRGDLPAAGLMPVWITERIAGGNDGGWSSPIVAGGRVYLYSHARVKAADAELPKRKYPYLADDKRGHLSAAEYAEYEVKRRAEDQAFSEFYRYHEALYCFDAASGQPIWKQERPSVYTRFLHSGTPALVDGRIFVLGAARMARCFDAGTGALRWETRLPGEFTDEHMASSFAVADGVAAILAGRLFGLEVASGSILWQGDARTTRGTHSSPAVWSHSGHDWFIVNVAGDSTICLEPRTGNERWRIKSLANLSTPLIVGDRLVTLGDQRRGGLRCFDLAEAGATERWAYQRIADKGSSPVAIDGHVYAQGERRLCCVNLDTGTEAWSTMLDLASPQYTSLIGGAGKVIYAFDGLLMFAADASEFRPLIAAKFDKQGLMASEAELRRQLKLAEVEAGPNGQERALRVFQQEVTNQGPLPCSSPALVDGKLYVRLRQSLACYDLAAP